MAYELRDHTADIAVAANADSMTDVFEATAAGFVAATCQEEPAGTGERYSITVTAETPDALLFDYLDELIYRRDVRAGLPVDHQIESIDHRPTSGDDAWCLEASARDAPLADLAARELKAVTYSEMRLEETDDGWEAYVVFDV